MATRHGQPEGTGLCMCPESVVTDFRIQSVCPGQTHPRLPGEEASAFITCPAQEMPGSTQTAQDKVDFSCQSFLFTYPLLIWERGQRAETMVTEPEKTTEAWVSDKAWRGSLPVSLLLTHAAHSAHLNQRRENRRFEWICDYLMSDGKESALSVGDLVQSLGWEHPLEEGMATHSSTLAWRNPMDRGAWWAAVHGVRESDTAEETQHSCMTPHS